MMDKRKLKLLEVEQLPLAIETSQISDGQKVKYAFVAKRHTIGEEQILSVTFFSLKKRVAEFRVFFNRETFAAEWLISRTGHHEGRKWSDATLEWFSDWHIGGRDAAVCVNSHSTSLIQKFFKTKESPFTAMCAFQKDLRAQQLKARHKRETDQIDDLMKTVEELPMDFNHWVNEVALDFSRYIYYKRQSKRHITGYCTSCKKDMDFHITKETPHENVRHNLSGYCPLCKKAVTFKAIGRTTQQIDNTVGAYAQKTETGFLFRYFNIKRLYFDHYRNPTLDVTELMRDFHAPNEAGVWQLDSYEYADYKQKRVMRWCKAREIYQLDNACLYTRNIRKVMEDTEWKYSGIYELAENMDRFNVYGYLRAYKSHPAYEYLVKLRLYRLVAGNVGGSYRNLNDFDFGGKGFQGVLGIDREQLNQMQRLNGTYKHLRMIRDAGQPLSDEHVEQLVCMEVDSGIFAELLAFTTAHKIIGYTQRCKQGWESPQADAYSLRNQYHSITEYWRDYLQNCQLLGYDTKDDFILFPRDLKAAHDDVMEQYKRKKDELADRAIAEMFETLLSQFGFEHKGFIVRPPASVDEIVAEGHTLHHCVATGSYIDNMAKGKLYILFIRREEHPDEPFYTVEVSNGKLTQCRGARNCDMTLEVKKFVEAWKKKKLKAA